jgi:hypothetical protein
MQRIYATLTLIFALTGVAVPVSAQAGNQRLADANRSAMEAYNNLDMEVAKRTLEDAAKGAERSGAKGPGLARTYANLGVVLVGGMGDKDAGGNAFVRALREDPSVEPDPIVATPEVMSVFNAAKKRAASAPAASEPEPTETPALSSGPSAAPATGNLDHEPVTEQVANTPIPVFVRKGDIEAETVKIFYRSLATAKPRSAQMRSADDGWAFVIPCDVVVDPTVEYFVVAEDSDGNRVGNFGDPEAPVSVSVVSSLSGPAPSLPGMAPPKSCAAQLESECPPGLPGCHTGTASLGGACSTDNDCSTGLVCEDDICSLEGRGSKSSKKDTSFFVEAAFGVGATYVTGSSAVDRALSPEQFQAALVSGNNDPAATYEVLRRQGFDCDVTTSTGADGTTKLNANNCGLAVKSSGFVAVPALHVAAGYVITPAINVALTLRYQLSSGQGTMAGKAIGVRGEYLLTKPKPTGLRAGVTLGAALGTVQAQAATDRGTPPFATSANTNGIGMLLQGGIRGSYRVTKNVGIIAAPTLVLALPKTLFAIDIIAGVEAAF